MQTNTINRRHFIKVSAFTGGGLVLGFLLPGSARAGKDIQLIGADPDCAVFQPNAYLQIDKTGKIIIFVAQQEMGQGVHTSLPMILAEELEADWQNILVEIAPYGTMKPGEHDTGGSQSVLTTYDTLRKAGATAKSMLLSAAAQKWSITSNQCRVESGYIVNTINNVRLSFGDLACDAAALPVPKEVSIKNPKDFKLIGRTEQKYKLKAVLTGQTKYGIDVKVPGMVYASVERCPVLDGKLVHVDDSACRQVSGFIKTVSFENSGMPMHLHAGVAVIATNIWSAMKARKLLKIQWDEGTQNKESTDALFREFAITAKKKPQFEVYKKGDVTKVPAAPGNSLESVYAAPFLAHGTMEPMNFIADVKPDSCELWGGLQMPDWATEIIGKELGLKKEQIKVHLTLIGGGFGRRLHHDFALEAVRIARQLDKPVKVIWNRTDDVRNDAYRPANYHRLQAVWDNSGKLQSWQHHQVATSISIMTEGPDSKNIPEILGGASSDLWYDVPNMLMGYSSANFNLNRGWLRAVEICVNVFPVESFIDEIAHRLKKDPLHYRLSLLEGRPTRETDITKFQQDPKRIAGVLKLAAEKIGWDKPRDKNHFMGIAGHHFTFAKAYAAHAIEIEWLGTPKRFRIKKIVAVVDCGVVINPDGLKNQMEGGAVFALSQALKGEITVKDSRVVQDGFFTYELLRYPEMPAIEVYAVPSTEEPGGIGEVGMPTLAPALCNALAAAGFRPKTLPIRKEGFSWTAI